MSLTRLIKLALGAAFVASGCAEPEPEPDWIRQGEWIDVAGHGRTADETCKGTFDYLDRYAKALSVEFGGNEHLGVYHWYSDAMYEAERPCGSYYACTGRHDGAASASIPVDHELSHMANDVRGVSCPSLIEEGLAVYYSTNGATPAAGDFELLMRRFGAIDEPLAAAEYFVAAQFVGFLVREHGLDAVLAVCQRTGKQPDAGDFASAMYAVFGKSPEDLLAEVGNDSECRLWSSFQSRVFVCGKAGAARRAGVVDERLLLEYRMGCGEENTTASERWGTARGAIRIIEQIDFLHSGPHWVAMFDEDNNVPPVELIVAPCQPCKTVLNTFLPGDALGPLTIEAGPHWLEMRADEDFSGEFTLYFERLP